jgi:hypothetical protein
VKLSEVKVGETYLTKIGPNLVRVVVVRSEVRPARPALPGYNGRASLTRFLIRRERDAQVLQKMRTAAALRPLPTPKERVFAIKTDSEKFRSALAECAEGVYRQDDDLVGPEVVERFAARLVVKRAAQKHGHRVMQQGDSFECSVCSASCALDPAELKVRGSLFTVACSPGGDA